MYLLQSLKFAEKYSMTETRNKSTLICWFLFFASVIAMFVVYKIGGGYCSMVLPFIGTFLALAMKLL